MKLTNKTLTWLVAGIVSIVLVAGANAQTAKERTGKVVRIKGAARYSTGNKIWQPLKVGTILKSGAVVQTAADSYADIVINENASADVVSMPARSATPTAASASGGGSGGNKSPEYDVIRVQNDSVVAIDKVSATDTGADRVTETELDLRTGSLFFSVKKQAAASRFEVKVPNGVAGIRGTTGIIFADGRIICLTGSIVTAFTDSTGKVSTVVVPAGSQFDPTTGKVSAMDSATFEKFQSIYQDTNYGSSGGNTPAFQNFQKLGRESMNGGRLPISPTTPPVTPPIPD
jgi:hypothetical protein